MLTTIPTTRNALRLTKEGQGLDRKSTRLNSSHANISYAVFCWKKKSAGPGFTTGTTGVAAGGGSRPPTTGGVGVGAGGGSRPPTNGGVGVGAGAAAPTICSPRMIAKPAPWVCAFCDHVLGSESTTT